MFPLLEASVATEKNISTFKSAVPKLRVAMPWGGTELCLRRSQKAEKQDVLGRTKSPTVPT